MIKKLNRRTETAQRYIVYITIYANEETFSHLLVGWSVCLCE